MNVERMYIKFEFGKQNKNNNNKNKRKLKTKVGDFKRIK